MLPMKIALVVETEASVRYFILVSTLRILPSLFVSLFSFFPQKKGGGHGKIRLVYSLISILRCVCDQVQSQISLGCGQAFVG